MKYIEIQNSKVLIEKEFKNSFLVVNSTDDILFKSLNLNEVFQYLKDNNLYNEYLESCN